MDTTTIQSTLAASDLAAIAFAIMLGAGIISLARHVQAAALHDAAHDLRHATGFPCH